MVITIDQIVKDVKNRKLSPLYIFDGEETYFTDYLTEYLENHLIEENQRSFDQSILYGKDVDEQTILTSVMRFPMMAPKTVVIVKEAQNLKDFNYFRHYLENPPAHSILVLALKGKSLDKRTSFGKKAEKEAVYFSGKKLREEEIPSWISSHLSKEGYKAEAEAAQLMGEYMGNDLGHITNELTKLKLVIKKGETITSHHVEQYIGISREYNVFELNKCLGLKQGEKAMRIVRYFQRNPKAAPFEMVVGTLYRYFNQLLLFHHAAALSDGDKAKILGVNPYFLQEFAIAKRNYPIEKVEQNLAILLAYDLRNKGYNDAFHNPIELLKEMVLKLL